MMPHTAWRASGNTAGRETARIAWLLFLGVSLIYIAISRGVFLYGDDILMYQVTEAIVERGTVAVTSPAAREVDDPAFSAAAIPGSDGERYAKYGIGQSLVAIPFYMLADIALEPLLPLDERVDRFGNEYASVRIYGTALLNPIVGGATVALTFLLAIAVGYSRHTALVLAALLASGTLLAHYSTGFLSEPLTALCLLATVYGLVRFARAPVGSSARWPLAWLALSGFTAGLALATRIAIVVALLAPGIWLLVLLWHRWRRGDNRRRVSAAGIAWGGPIVLWLLGIGGYNWVRFGSVWQSGYGDEAWTFTTPFWTGFFGLLVSPGRGAIPYDPPLLLALAGSLWFARRRPALALTILGMLAGTLALSSRYYAWHGGGVWGARFLVPLLPLLLLPAGEIVERAWKDRRFAAAVVVLGVLGIVGVGLSVLVPFDEHVVDPLASSARGDDVLWDPRDAPLVLHAESIVTQPAWPDIAAVRYASVHLALLTGLAGVAGVALLWRAIVLTLRPSLAASASGDSQSDRVVHRAEIAEQD